MFAYEHPKDNLRPLKVKRGTEPARGTFRGSRRGTCHEGVARIFSKKCPGETTEYDVSGPIVHGSTTVVLVGTRPVYNPCRRTESYT